MTHASESTQRQADLPNRLNEMQTSAMFKGSKKFTSAVKTTFVLVLLSQSYGYIIHNISELCSEFCVVDVGLIMALLRRDYSC